MPGDWIRNVQNEVMLDSTVWPHVHDYITRVIAEEALQRSHQPQLRSQAVYQSNHAASASPARELTISFADAPPARLSLRCSAPAPMCSPLGLTQRPCP